MHSPREFTLSAYGREAQKAVHLQVISLPAMSIRFSNLGLQMPFFGQQIWKQIPRLPGKQSLYMTKQAHSLPAEQPMHRESGTGKFQHKRIFIKITMLFWGKLAKKISALAPLFGARILPPGALVSRWIVARRILKSISTQIARSTDPGRPFTSVRSCARLSMDVMAQLHLPPCR